jgi:hypothetical protein
MVRVAAVHVHFTMLVALTLGELLTTELLMAHATPSTVFVPGWVVVSAGPDEQADRLANVNAIVDSSEERPNIGILEWRGPTSTTRLTRRPRAR